MGDDGAEDAVSDREPPDGCSLLGGEADGDELREARTVLGENAERPVAGPDEAGRLLDDRGEQGGEVRIDLDGQDGVDDRLEPGGVRDPVVRHRFSIPSRTQRSVGAPSGTCAGDVVEGEP